ncbi:polysaccharide export protein, Wza family [Erythrobacter litoralis]|uniref:Capsule biosynthesis protein n=1 Tax=Erythrobacter litoralis TaxID=39960 RepID=A0A074MYK6_9SPHN|nr:polysaccharide biosynthesis/export family protein [Erythrobacter litoralis]AOL22041.1 polysaccharide export protein, Wza family [Erythrobacter litoralis]KEO90702.1 capsule biosynthesis protein [Erythrobacter litoralis]
MNLRIVFGTLALCLLSACATLPSSGPTGDQIEDTASEVNDDGLDIKIVPVETPEAIPPALPPEQWQLPNAEASPTDQITAGDVLSITIFEAGVALFSGDAPAAVAPGGGFDPSVRSQTLPPRRVDDYGFIDVPYAGRVPVDGSTVAEVEATIRDRLRGLSQDPQVLVSREQIIGNSVIVGGEVANPGRLVLHTNRESFSDIVALSGGYRGEMRNLVLQVERGDQVARLRLADVMSGPYSRLRAAPGDRLTVISDPMTFSVLGASGRVQQMPFNRERMSVVEAIAMAGGPSDNTGDPQAVFLFRYAGDEGTEPTVYHFNMMEAPTFFLAQRFMLRDKDVLYFGNSASNQPRKLIQTIGQLFSPIVTATALTNNIGGGNGGSN